MVIGQGDVGGDDVTGFTVPPDQVGDEGLFMPPTDDQRRESLAVELRPRS
jgi:hypothetical protein